MRRSTKTDIPYLFAGGLEICGVSGPDAWEPSSENLGYILRRYGWVWLGWFFEKAKIKPTQCRHWFISECITA